MNLLQFKFILTCFALVLGFQAPAIAEMLYGVGGTGIYWGDTDNNAVLDTIQITGHDIAVTPDGNFIYITDPTTDSVLVINKITKEIIATIPVGKTPTRIAITPNGLFAYVINRSSWTVSVIDLTTNTLVGAPINVETLPSSVDITPDGLFAYVTNALSNSISIIDTTTNTVAKTIASRGTGPNDIAISPDGLFAYVANHLSKTITVISTATGSVVATIRGFAALGRLAITPNGLFVYVANGINVAVISTTDKKIVATIPIPTASQNPLAITADGSRVYVGSDGCKHVFVIDTTTNLVKEFFSAFPNTGIAMSEF